MTQRVTDRDLVLSGLPKLRPITRDRLVQPNTAAVNENQHTESGHRLGHRIDVHKRVALKPNATPEIRNGLDGLAVEPRYKRRTGLTELGEASLERVADRLKP